MITLPRSLCETVGLAPGEQPELARFDAATGDYRVWALALKETDEGGEQLTAELHRQGPGFSRRIFPLLTIVLAPQRQTTYRIEQCYTDAGLAVETLPHTLPRLAQIATALKNQHRPNDALLLPFLSKRGQILWQQPLRRNLAS